METNTATVASGSTVNLGPQPTTGGTWNWTGPNGYTALTRQLSAIPLTLGTNVYVATYNNGSCTSTEAFTITVTGSTPTFTLAASATSTSVTQGGSVNDTISVSE